MLDRNRKFSEFVGVGGLFLVKRGMKWGETYLGVEKKLNRRPTNCPKSDFTLFFMLKLLVFFFLLWTRFFSCAPPRRGPLLLLLPLLTSSSALTAFLWLTPPPLLSALTTPHLPPLPLGHVLRNWFGFSNPMSDFLVATFLWFAPLTKHGRRQRWSRRGCS